MICYYCKLENDDPKMYVKIMKAIKPKGYSKRWEVIGFCCVCCKKNNKESKIDLF